MDEQGIHGSELPFLKVSDMTQKGNEVWIDSASSTVSRDTAARLGAFVFPANSIVFPKVGGALLTNKRRLLRRASCIDNNIMGCIVGGADVQYAFFLFQWLDLARLAKPGPVPAIGEGDVREIKVALPPHAEQIAFVRTIHRITVDLNRAMAAAEREIALLSEWRTRLIADVITGKLDVREAAARLPDEPDEPEPLDDTYASAEDDDEADLDQAPEEADA